MEPIYLLGLASRKSAWLAARQATVAANVANANTPGYRAREIASFNDVLAHTGLTLASTNGGHLQPSNAGEIVSRAVDKEDNLDEADNGNSVGIEQEMTKVGEINREYALTTNIVRNFHSLLMASLKG